MVNIILKSTLTAILLASCASYAEVVVITNKEMPVTSLSQEEIYRIYLGKTKFLPNGVKVIPVDQRPGSAAREKFYADIIKKSDTEMKSYWSRVIFTGQGYPPIQENDDQSVRELVAKNPNTMGYIDKSYADGSVKIIFTAP
jgi:ABC-type phosphate transport system substrate-binding protein